MRRLALLFVLFTALAVPAIADEAEKKWCDGELFVINGKTYCMVVGNPEDWYRRDGEPDKPAPGSLVRLPDEPEPPHLKLAGSLLVNSMMAQQFDDFRYNYTGRTGKYGWPRMDSRTSLVRERLGWGLSAQWSADGVWWFEASWERPERLTIGIDTTRITSEFHWYCVNNGVSGLCPARGAAYQTNRHEFTADDFTFGVLYDLSKDEVDKHFSLLLGGGVHRRYIRDRYSVSTRSGTEFYRGGGFTNLAGINDRNDTDSEGNTKAAQTRIFGQIDLELYPAGKDRFIGLVLSARVLSDGDREQNFPTSTLNDEEVLLGVKPGFYDVTARLIVRF